MRTGIATFVTDQGVGPAALARAVEERGFDSLFIAEHTHIPASRRTPYPGGGELPEMYYRTLDPFVTLAAAAVATENLLLGTGIALLAQRDPFITAKEVASIDLISGGRAVFGVGVGWNREEMENHGVDPTTRGRLVDEKLLAIRELWTEEKAEFHGDFVDFDPVFSWPKPVRRPHPPIYVGGGEGAFPRIARFGDAWLANSVPAEQLGEQMRKLNEFADREVPVTVFAAPRHGAGGLDAYAELGVERVLLFLPPGEEADTLRRLDRLAGESASYR